MTFTFVKFHTTIYISFDLEPETDSGKIIEEMEWDIEELKLNLKLYAEQINGTGFIEYREMTHQAYYQQQQDEEKLGSFVEDDTKQVTVLFK